MGAERFALALTAGMLATVNPCGLPMLPAYLTFFISGDDADDRGDLAAVVRAVGVALVVSFGFMVVFGSLGALVSWGARRVYGITPWVTVVVGVALIALGIYLLAGRELSVALPKLNRGGRSRGLWSMFVFGVSYAIASVSCTLPVFLSQVGGLFRGDDVIQGVAVFLTYATGMAAVLIALSVSLALARTGLVNTLRRSLGVINRVAGAFLLVAGAYITWFAIYEIGKRDDSDPAVDRVTGWSADLSNRVTDVGVYPLLGILVGVVVVALGVAWYRANRADTTESGPARLDEASRG